MATLKPTTPLLAPNKGALKPASPLRRKIAPKNAHFSPAKAMTVSIPRERERAKVTAVSDKARPAPTKAMAVSDNRPSWPTGSGCGARRRRQGLAGSRDDAPSHTPAHRAPLVWRAPEGSAAVPVGGGGAWPGFETTRRAKLAARAARGRAAAHRHTQRPGPPAPGTPVGTHSSPAQQGTHSSPPQRAAGASGARNTSGATCHLGITKPPGPTGAGRLSQFRKLSAESRQCRGLRGRSPGGRWKYRAWKQRPSRFPPCGDPRRRRWRSAWPSRRRSRRRCLRSRPG